MLQQLSADQENFLLSRKMSQMVSLAMFDLQHCDFQFVYVFLFLFLKFEKKVTRAADGMMISEKE